MKKVQSDAAPAAPVETREIPNPPGGGSWKFDEAKWEWISTKPVPEEPASTEPAVQTADPAQE